MSDLDRRILSETVSVLASIGAVSELEVSIPNSLRVRFKRRELLLVVRNQGDRWKRNRVLTDQEEAAFRVWPGPAFLVESARAAIVATLFGKNQPKGA